MDDQSVLEEYLVNTHAPIDVLHAMRNTTQYVELLENAAGPLEPLAELDALRTKLAAAEARVGELEAVMEHLRNYALIAARVSVECEPLMYIHDALAGKLTD